MLKRVVHLTATSLICLLASACAEGSDDQFTTFGTFGTTQPTTTTFGEEMDDETTGDGDGAPAGDGDGAPAGDGDGAPTGDGDGDGDPELCGNGVIDPGETCDGNNFGGVTCVDLGYDQGALTCTNCSASTSSCMNAPQPGLGQLYSHCLTPDGCPGLDGCATVTMMGQMDPFDGFCTNFCTTDAECFANVGGTAVPRCNTEASPYCELDCSGGKTCPGGMECIPLQGGKELCY